MSEETNSKLYQQYHDAAIRARDLECQVYNNKAVIARKKAENAELEAELPAIKKRYDEIIEKNNAELAEITAKVQGAKARSAEMTEDIAILRARLAFPWLGKDATRAESLDMARMVPHAFESPSKAAELKRIDAAFTDSRIRQLDAENSHLIKEVELLRARLADEGVRY